MPPRLTLIAAIARNGVIGKGNALPWHLPEDLKHFKQLTTGQAVIMGRKTWESLPPKFRPLPNRLNIVITRNADYLAPGATVVPSLPAAIAAAGLADNDEVFVIGGAETYAQALAIADRLQFTEIDADFEGDAHFPDWDRSQWRETARDSRRSPDNRVAWDYAFVTRERR